MIDTIIDFQKELRQSPMPKKERIPNELFYLYLNMIPSIMNHSLTDQLKVCKGSDKAVKQRLMKMNIKDRTSLDACIRYNYQCGVQYQQFLTFWDGNPCFDIEKQTEKVKAYIRFCEAYAKQFYPLVKRFGFYAWDISESIHCIRCAYTCGYITRNEAAGKIQKYVDLARKYFTNFNDYALSYLCGGMYYMMRESRDEAMVEKLLSASMRICRYLFFEADRLWAKTSWLIQSDYFKELDEIVDKGLNQGNAGCFVSNRISVDGCKIAYFYREKAMTQFPDSGWRFFAGDESEAYLDDPKHAHIFALNTVANACPKVIPFLDMPIGSAFRLAQDGSYQLLSMGEEHEKRDI